MSFSVHTHETGETIVASLLPIVLPAKKQHVHRALRLSFAALCAAK
jgi:hypothetical protein